MLWFVEADQFGFKVFIKDRPCTRRGILSAVSSLYDPLGMATPFILPAKLLLQDLCRRGLGWDDEVPDLHLTHWLAWVDDLPKISRIAIGRCVKPVKSSDPRISLHVRSIISATPLRWPMAPYHIFA